jgi:hypothetical protein
MSSRTLVHQLLFEALLEMRQRGHDSGDKVVFHLSDLFHNAVLQLDGADDQSREDEVLEFIKRRAKEKGCEEWLRQHLDRIELKASAG